MVLYLISIEQKPWNMIVLAAMSLGIRQNAERKRPKFSAGNRDPLIEDAYCVQII